MGVTDFTSSLYYLQGVQFIKFELEYSFHTELYLADCILYIPSFLFNIYIFGGQKMKCPYKDNRFENTTSKYIYDEDGSLIENKITTCTASTFGKCDGEECAAYKDGVCQYVLVEKGG